MQEFKKSGIYEGRYVLLEAVKQIFVTYFRAYDKLFGITRKCKFERHTEVNKKKNAKLFHEQL